MSAERVYTFLIKMFTGRNIVFIIPFAKKNAFSEGKKHFL